MYRKFTCALLLVILACVAKACASEITLTSVGQTVGGDLETVLKEWGVAGPTQS